MEFAKDEIYKTSGNPLGGFPEVLLSYFGGESGIWTHDQGLMSPLLYH